VADHALDFQDAIEKSHYQMNWRVLGAMVILPCTGLVLIPAAILRLSRNTKLAADLAGCNQIELWAGIFVGAAGLILMLWKVSLFSKVGRGTPAPWNPPKRLVVQGPYRHVRNPMITGVLLAEALIFQSWPEIIPISTDIHFEEEGYVMTDLYAPPRFSMP